MAGGRRSIRKTILDISGQDLRKCRGCMDCDYKTPKDMDLGFGTMVQMILMNDQDILDSDLIWDDKAYLTSTNACNKQLNLNQVIDVLREMDNSDIWENKK